MTSRLWFVPVLLLALGCQKTPPQPAAEGQTPPAAAAPAAAAPGTTASPAAAPGTTAPPAAAPGAAPTVAEPEPAKPVPAQLPAVVARVNGSAIDRAEFELAVRNIEERAGQPVPAEQRSEVYRRVLDRIITFHVLQQETKARGLTVSDAEIAARIGEIRKQFQTEEQFKAALAARKVDAKKFEENIRTDMLVDKLIESEVAGIAPVQEKEIVDFYKQNPERFKEGESVRASHILLRVEEGADPAAKKALQTKAESLLTEARAGKDFAALARQHSQDGSAQNGGNLNFFTKGQMVPPFEAAAFALKPGDISNVVETQFGYHIIKVTDRRPERTVPLDEVRPQLSEFLNTQARQAKTDELIARLKSKSKIEVLI